MYQTYLTMLFTTLISAATKTKESFAAVANRLLRRLRPLAYKLGYNQRPENESISIKDDFKSEFTAIVDAEISEKENLLDQKKADLATFTKALETIDRAKELSKAKNASSEDKALEMQPLLEAKAKAKIDISSANSNLADIEAEEEEFYRQNPSKNRNENETFLNSKIGLILFVPLHFGVETPYIQKAFSDAKLLDNLGAWITAGASTILVIIMYLLFGKAMAERKYKLAAFAAAVPTLLFGITLYLRQGVLEDNQFFALVGLSLLFLLVGCLLGFKYFEYHDVFWFRKEKSKARKDRDQKAENLEKINLEIRGVDEKYKADAEFEVDGVVAELEQKMLDTGREIVALQGSISSRKLEKQELLESGLRSIEQAYAQGKSSRNQYGNFKTLTILLIFLSVLSSCSHSNDATGNNTFSIGIPIDHSQTVNKGHLPEIDQVIHYIEKEADLSEESYSPKKVEVRITSAGDSGLRRYETIVFDFPGYWKTSGDQYETSLAEFYKKVRSTLVKYYEEAGKESDTMIYGALCQNANWMKEGSIKRLLFLSDMIEDSRLVQFDEIYLSNDRYYIDQYDSISHIFEDYCPLDLRDIEITAVYPPDKISDGQHTASRGFWNRFINEKGGKILFAASL